VIAAGEVVLEDAWRAFALGDRRRTLKELMLRRSAAGADSTQALAGVDLRVGPGETLGIVGRNGAGKTSTLRVLAGIVPLERGRAECGGRVATLIELGAGFGREFTGRENIELNGALNGLTKRQVEERIDDIIEFSELGHFIDVPVRTYSSGMLVRLGFAIAAHLDADVMLIDEVLAVGDEAFQRKCLRRINERILAGATLVLVSHAPAAIERTCSRVVVLDGGKVVFDGPTAEALLHYHELLGEEQVVNRLPAADRTVYVDNVTLLDGDDRPRTVFSTGEPLRIVLDIGVKPGAVPTRIAFELRKSSGEPVFAAGHEVDLREPARLSFDIPALHLLGGDYDLVVAAQQDDGIDRLVGLSVADTPEVEGVVDLRGSWRHDA
jgi:ABC-type polysaccharide/polyol phosphate transport system ATPase subunit